MTQEAGEASMEWKPDSSGHTDQISPGSVCSKPQPLPSGAPTPPPPDAPLSPPPAGLLLIYPCLGRAASRMALINQSLQPFPSLSHASRSTRLSMVSQWACGPRTSGLPGMELLVRHPSSHTLCSAPLCRAICPSGPASLPLMMWRPGASPVPPADGW